MRQLHTSGAACAGGARGVSRRSRAARIFSSYGLIDVLAGSFIKAHQFRKTKTEKQKQKNGRRSVTFPTPVRPI